MSAQSDQDKRASAESAAKPVQDSEPQPDDKAGLKLAIDLIPLAVFFIAYRFVGLKTATAILVVTTLLSLAAAKVLLGKISPMLLVSAVIVTAFGGLTLALDDPRFIYIKPTIVNLMFAGAIGAGLLTGRNVLKYLLSDALKLTDEGWRLLSLRWMALFVGLAALNEFVWRTQSEQTWVNFKFPGILVLSFAFMALQAPLIKRHLIKPPQS